ncbi:MAG: hypothetical protein ACOX9B_15395 [Candidatus Xenobium sp.]
MMNARTVKFLAGFGLLVLAVAVLWPVHPARADSSLAFLANRDLSRLGVDRPDLFWPAQLSRDGRTLLATEDLEGEATRSGALSRLWILRFNSDGSVREARKIPLKMPRFLQLTMTPDERGVVLLAREGASFWYLDLQTGDLREFIHSGMGVTRFVAQPHVLWPYQGRLYTLGHPLDTNGTRQGLTLVTLAPDRTDEQAIGSTGVDVAAVYDHFDQVRNARWLDPSLAFIGGTLQGTFKMTCWKKDSGFHEIATLDRVTSMLGMGGHLALTGVSKQGLSLAMLFDASSGNLWEAPALPPEREYNYPFISEDAGTLVLTEGRKAGQLINLLYGRQQSGYDLKPLPGLQNKKPGVLRLAAQGSHLVFRNPDGLYYAAIPPGR